MKRSQKKWLGASKPAANAPQLACYTLPGGHPINLRPAPHTRPWMDETPDQFAYRCLPLAIANAHAWELLNPVPFEATWNGAVRGGVTIRPLDGRAPIVQDHFGSGILTFYVGALFRTAPGMNLWVMGPTNHPKHGLYALHAVVRHALVGRTTSSPDRVFDYYLSLLERHPESQLLEQTNLFAAMDHAQRAGNLSAMLRIDQLLARL